MGFITLTNEYYEGDRINLEDQAVENRPSANHVWNGKEWQEESLPNWDGILDDVRGSALFNKVYAASQTNPAIQSDYMLLTATLMSRSPAVADLQFALNQIKSKLGVMLTFANIQQINDLLKKYNFDFEI